MSETTRRRLFYLLVFLAIAFLFHAREMFGQSARTGPVLGGSVGTYYVAGGGHPRFFTDLQARAGYGWAVAEFEHAPLVMTGSGGGSVDLFSLSLGLDIPFLIPGTFVPARVGWSRFREWTCGGTSCSAVPGPGQRFTHFDGLRVQSGLGLRLGAGRAELRAAYTEYGGVDMILLFGLEVRP